MASCGFLVASPLPAPRRDRGRAAHPPYFGPYLFQQSPIPAEGKRDKTGPYTQPQSEGMRTSKISPAFSGSRDADLIFHFGNFDSQICKAQAQPFREFGPISLPGAGATIAHPHVQIPMRRSNFSHV